MPDSEIILWSYLKRKQLNGYKFRRQYSIGNYVVDFYCPKLKLVIEIDGDSHFTLDAIKYDNTRTNFIKSVGIRIIRFTNLDIKYNIEQVLLEIIKTLRPPASGRQQSDAVPL